MTVGGTATTRTPQEVFGHHAEALVGGDIDGIVADYSDDAVFISPAGVLRGKDGVRQAFTLLLDELPQGKWEVPTAIFEDDALFITWTCRTANHQVDDGVDTFIFRDGLIRLQTVRYTRTAR